MGNLSRKAKVYIWGMLLAGAALSIWRLTYFHLQNPWLFAVLSLLACITHVLKVEGPTPKSNYQISFMVYGFTLALLGVDAAILVILIAHLAEWAWYRYPWYIQSFNMGSFVVTMSLAGAVYAWVASLLPGSGFVLVMAYLGSMIVFTLINHLTVGLVLKLARGESFASSEVFGDLPLMIDFSLFGLGAAASVIWKANPYAIILVIIPLYLIYITVKVPALKRQADTDPKTGLFNAGYFVKALEAEFKRADRFDRPIALAMADLDLMRDINNVYGHLAGDKVLIGIANILKASALDYDMVFRFGGEEFALLMPETSLEDALRRVEEIRCKVEQAEFDITSSIFPIKITISFGVAVRGPDVHTPNDLIQHADLAMYQAKQEGRNRTCSFTTDLFARFPYHEETFIIHNG